jgi:hypothetical protein
MIFVDPSTGRIIEPPGPPDWVQVPYRAPAKASLASRIVALPDGTYMIPADAMMTDVTGAIAADGTVEIR